MPLVFGAILADEEVQVMIDCGANQNYASPQLAERLQKQCRQKAKPYPLNMADGTPVEYGGGWIRREIRDVRLEIEGHTEQIDLDIAPIKYDIILGMKWLQKQGPAIDWQERTLTFPNRSHGNKKKDRSSSGSPIRAIWVRPNRKILADMTEEIPEEYRDFADLFKEREGLAALPEHKPWDHEIPLEDGKVPKHNGWLRRLSKKEEDFLKDYIEKHEKKGFIRPSKSSIAHGVLFAPKKDGGLRVCIDYRPLNTITKKNRYPLPRIDELQDRLLGAKYFTAIDVRDAYYRVRMKEGEEWKTAFKTRFGLYEYLVMPFGLTNAPATFQELINDTLREYLDDFATAYLDDVLIFSTTLKEHVQHVRKVLDRLRQKDLPVKLSKCEFHKHRIRFLGHIISDKGIEVDPERIKSIQEWPQPTNVTEIQAFVGLVNYDRKFIEGFSRVAAPLTNLTKKETEFLFGPKCKEAFEKLKEAITSAPILAIFKPEYETNLETDASDGAIGARLTQKGNDGKLHTIAYYSRKMTGPELNYDIHDKELLAMVEAFKEWRVYLEGAKYPTQVYTDHKNLLYWTTTKQLNRRQVRWAETLAPFDFRIHHVRGKENAVADALSRRPDYMKNIQPEPMAILKERDGALTYATPQTETLAAMDIELTTEQKKEVIQSRHDDRSAGHPGIEKTIELVTRDFTWKGIRKDVMEYVKNCDTCHKAKHARHKPYYLVKWLGYDNSENTWEPMEHLTRGLIQQYHRRNRPSEQERAQRRDPRKRRIDLRTRLGRMLRR